MWYLGDSLEWSLALPQIKSRYYTLSYWIFCHFFVDCKCKTKQLWKDFILQRQTGRKRDQAAKKSCNVYRVILDLLHDFHVTGKNSNAYRITLLSSKNFPAFITRFPCLFPVLPSLVLQYTETHYEKRLTKSLYFGFN